MILRILWYLYGAPAQNSADVSAVCDRYARKMFFLVVISYDRVEKNRKVTSGTVLACRAPRTLSTRALKALCLTSFANTALVLPSPDSCTRTKMSRSDSRPHCMEEGAGALPARSLAEIQGDHTMR